MATFRPNKLKLYISLLCCSTPLTLYPILGKAAPVLEEVIVEAQKKSETISETPIAVSAVTGEQFQETASFNLQDIARTTPGLAFDTGVNTDIHLRGISTVALAAVSLRTNIYQDGALIEQPRTLFDAQFDIERFEVLKGPQGTLYGKSSPTGTINIRTKNPSLTDFGGYIAGSVGEYNMRNAQFGVSIPIIEGELAVRIAGVYDTNQATHQRNVVTGSTATSRGTGARVTVLWQPSDDFSARFSYHYREKKDNPWLTVNGDNFKYEKDLLMTNVQDRNEVLNQLAVLEVTKTLNEHLSIVSVTGYEDQDYVNVQDTDGTRSGDPALPLGDIQKTHIPLRPQIQEDLRLVSEDNAFWDWQVGGYYHRETTETKVSAIQLANQAGNIAPVELDTIAALSAEEFAVYTHNTFKVTDQLNIIAGLRYQQVRYNSHQPTEAYVTTSTGQRLIDLVATGFIPGNGMPLDEAKQTYYPVTGTLKAQYFFSPDLMGYITGDYAYRTGALNLNIQGNLPPEFAMIDPESAASAEMGLKGTFGNQRGRFATALFYQLYDDFQQDIQNVWVFQTTGIPALRTANLLRNAVVNAGQSVTKGIEADVSWMLTDTWSASFAAAYTIAKYTDFKNNLCSPVPTPSAANPGPLSLTTPFVTCDLTGEPLPQAPRWSGVVQSNYSHPLNDEIDWYFNGLLNFTSTQVDKVTRKTLSGYSTMDLFTGLRQADKQGWDVNLWVKNVFDRRVITRIFNPNVADPRTGKTFDLVGTNLPRQVGITGTYRFE